MAYEYINRIHLAHDGVIDIGLLRTLQSVIGSSRNATSHLCMYVLTYIDLETSAAHNIKRLITV